MSEQIEQKPELPESELEFRRARKMSNRQLLNHLKNIARKEKSNLRATWAIVLAVVFENTKPLGKVDSGLR
jgi:hypothetical protein